jgi:hypothetical protein
MRRWAEATSTPFRHAADRPVEATGAAKRFALVPEAKQLNAGARCMAAS